jgi:hypothetical protein
LSRVEECNQKPQMRLAKKVKLLLSAETNREPRMCLAKKVSLTGRICDSNIESFSVSKYESHYLVMVVSATTTSGTPSDSIAAMKSAVNKKKRKVDDAKGNKTAMLDQSPTINQRRKVTKQKYGK